MMNFIKKHRLKILIGFVILITLFFLYGGVSGLIARHNYNKSIKEKDATISSLWGKIGDSKKREDKWMVSSEANYALAMDKEVIIRRKDAEMRVKLAEKRELKKQIREMPVTQVIVRTIEIINCPDVVQQEQGVVFTLDCAKNNLVILENVFYFKKEALDWADQFLTSQAEVADLKNVIIAKDGAYAERGVQLTAAYDIRDEWEDKFNLSEKRGKRSWWKGAKTGAAVVGVIAFFAGFFLAK